jgi:outer membrane scaffolding protein for murein synthesis (MipA/OmpV family)
MLKPAIPARLLIATIALASLCQHAAAQRQPGGSEDGLFTGVTAAPAVSSWGLGVAVATERETYRDAGNKTQAIPLLMYDSEYVRVFGNMVDLKLPSAAGIRFAVRAKYGLGAGYEADDSPYLAGMAERKGSLWLGGAATWKSPLLSLSAEWLKAGGASKGQQFNLTAEHTFGFGRLQLTPHLGALWKDDKNVDYYYGVRAAEATAARPAYTGTATTDINAGGRLDYAVRPNQLILLDISSTHRGAGISDSPLVPRTTAPSLRLGYLYKF